MATVPFGVWMNQENVPPVRTGSFSSSSTSTTAMLRSLKTPSTSTSRNGLSPTKAAHPDAANFSLQLTKVLGTTIGAVSGFAYGDSCFATIAGSTAVVHHVDEDYNVSQRFFRARPSASPAGQMIASPSTEGPPVTPEQPRYRSVASVRTSILGARTPNSPMGSDFAGSPAKLVARQRTRAAACLALSPDGKLLAIGETGYSPRVLIFSLASNGFEAPIATLNDHTSGVRCVKFSPDSKWMCSVGDIHDGYICLWSINQRTGVPKLHSTNKCTSMINDMTFMSNGTIVTVGTRHVRVWRNEEKKPPSPTKTKLRLDIATFNGPSSPGFARALAGRNCLLGSLLEAKSFTCVQAYSETKAFICSDRGDLCLVDNSEGHQKLQCVRRFPFAIRCISIDFAKELVWIGGDTPELHSIPLEHVLNPSRPISPSKEPALSSGGAVEEPAPPKTLSGLAVGIVRGRTVLIDSDRNIKLLKADGDDKVDITEAERTAPSHSSPVLGVDVRYDECGEVIGFITWEASGAVLFWNKFYEHERSCTVPLDPAATPEEDANELKVVLPLSSGQRFVSGDKKGTLRLFDSANWGHIHTVNAHSGEVTDIVQARCDDADIIISSGRDRMIQIFEVTGDELTLTQTIESHGSSVNELLSVENGRLLLSASSDRTIMVNALASTPQSRAYVPVRTITLKSTPASVTLSSEDSNDVIVTTLDKQLMRFSIVDGQSSQTSIGDSIRLTDIEESESVLLTSAATRTVRATSGPSQLLLGVSSTDKSLRVHNAYTGSTLLKDFGHSEGISSMIVLEEAHDGGNSWYSIVSTGVDGTIMRWELTNTVPGMAGQSSVPSSPAAEVPPVIQPPPLRRVLSRSALAEYAKVLEADGTFPVPTVSSRNPSPNRLKKKFSTFSIGSGSGRSRMSRPSILPSRNNSILPNRSPSPPSPSSGGADSTPTQARVRPSLPDRAKTKSTNALNDTLHQSTEQVSKNLRTYRKKLNMSSGLLKPETALELEKELIATVNVLTQRSRRQRTASGNNVGDLLDQYSEKVARLKEKARARESMAGSQGLSSPSTATANVRRIRERPMLSQQQQQNKQQQQQQQEEGSSKDDSV